MKQALRQWGVACVVVTTCVSTGWAAPSEAPADTLRFQLEFSTLLGGSEYDDVREVILLPDGSLLLGGQTLSPDFTVTAGAYQTRYGGEPAGMGHPGVYGGDCLLARLSADGRRILATTFFGGSKQERDVYGMALDTQGNIVLTTTTRSSDLPTTDGAFQRRYGGGEEEVMVAKLSSDLKRLIWCTYVGGSGNETPRGGLALDAAGNIYVGGGEEDLLRIVAISAQGEVCLVGRTASGDFKVTAGAALPKRSGNPDAFVVKLVPML